MEKGYSARDFLISESCRVENYLSDDIKYVGIGEILIKLKSSDILQSGPIEIEKWLTIYYLLTY